MHIANLRPRATKSNGQELPEGTRPLKRFGAVALRIAVALAAVWALARELHDVSVAGLIQQIRLLGWARIGLGLTYTVASFLLLGVIELLALRQTDDRSGNRVGVGAALRTGFVANALSQSIGIALLTGAAVRARAYARWQLDAVAVMQVTAFATITATLGLLTGGAVALFATAAPVSAGGFTFAVRPIAGLLGALVVAYVVWSAMGRTDGVGRGRWRIRRPSPRVAIGQIVLSTADWVITGAVLYAFLPTHQGLTPWLVLGSYLIAQVLAVTSHVPAGAGVFEVVIVALLVRGAPGVPPSALAAALVMFRMAYYLAPLCIAMVVAVLTERFGAEPAAPQRHGGRSTTALTSAPVQRAG